MNRNTNRTQWHGRIVFSNGGRKGSVIAPVTPPDSYHLSAASGWVELGNWQEAGDDLKKIQPAWRWHPDVLDVRYQVCAMAGQWGEAARTCRRLTRITPDRACGWLYLAVVLDELKRTKEAYDTLFLVVCHFPKHALMRYSLACLACKLELWTEASAWLKRAFDVGDAHRLMAVALKDPDLKPMWSRMGVAPCHYTAA